MTPKRFFAVLVLLCAGLSALGQGNGKLQLHFMDVGHGDGILLVSPKGETVLFDGGVKAEQHKPLSYLQQLGVTRIDYYIATHYHGDHIGSVAPILSEFPLQKAAYDRGNFQCREKIGDYTNTVQMKRKTAVEGSHITLDSGAANPVRIEFVALSGQGVANATNENDLCLVSVVRFGQFDAVLGADLSGETDVGYHDVESVVASKVGQVEVYKVHHHGSKYSSNEKWLDVIQPRIGLITVGQKRRLPDQEVLDRLHARHVTNYWTSCGDDAPPMPGLDKVGTNIVVEVAPKSTTFTVTYAGDQVDTYEVWNPVGPSSVYAWSKQAKIYHFTNCCYLANISQANLKTGKKPPRGAKLHLGCPK